MKKIIAIALVLVMCLSVMSMVAFAAEGKMTVKVTAPAEWEECYVYSWEPALFGDWPGTKLTTGSFELTGAVAGLVIGAGDGKPQTVDIKDLTFAAGTEATITVGEVVDGKHTYTISTGNDPQPTEPTQGTQPTQPTQGTQATQPTQGTQATQGNVTTGNRTLTVKAPASWKNVNIYTWEPEEFGAFPGSALTKSGSDYKVSIKNSMVNLIVSTKNADDTITKTDDLVLKTNGKNVTVTVAEDGKAEIAYEGEANTKPSTDNRKPAAEDPKGNLSNYRVVGNAAWMGSWDPASDLGRMTDMGNGVYRKNFDNVEPGSYQLKITKDGKWDGAYGDNGQNFTFTVDQKCKITVDFTLKGDVGVISVYGTGVPGTADISMVSVVILLALASVTAIVLVVNKKKFI